MIKILKKLKTLIPTVCVRNYGTIINVTEHYIEYSNGFSLLRLQNKIGLKAGQYIKEELNKYLVADVQEPKERIKYPNTDAVIPNTENYQEICLNGKILADLCNVLVADSEDKVLKIRFGSEKEPVTLEIDGHLGILVPIKEVT